MTAKSSNNRDGSIQGSRPRIGVASIVQETNTWSLVPCTLDDFVCQGLAVGAAVEDYTDTNTEIGGAMRAVLDEGCDVVPIIRAWANSSGRLTRTTLGELCRLLVAGLKRFHIDGLVLSLHGAMAAEGADDADLAVLQAARSALGPIPIGVCLDLHANVTDALVAASNFVTGYHTYPHTDLAETGARAAHILIAQLRGEAAPVTALAKCPMLVPAEAMSTSEGPLAALRAIADSLTIDGVLDVSLFPVQPWLDVSELGFAVTVTTNGDRELAEGIAGSLASQAWDRRHEFSVTLLSPSAAIEKARQSRVRPFLISESADAPTAGAAGDSPAMVRAMLGDGSDLKTYVTITDPPAVEQCVIAGAGASVNLSVGCHFDQRFDTPVAFTAIVERTGDDPVMLSGPSYTGMEVSMGRYAVVRAGRLCLLITERPAFTLDPATFLHAGLDPARVDVVVVRSALGFHAAFPPDSVAAAIVLDLPGASTPRLDLLEFVRAPRPLYPLDPDHEVMAARA